MFTCKVVSFRVLSLSERFAAHETGYVPGLIEHHGVSVAAEIRDRYQDPV
jgi:hypothetical protein